MTLPRMSHSRYEDYSSCGEKYRLKRIERVPMTPSIFSAAGTAFHTWADWWDSQPEDPPEFANEGLFIDTLTRLVAEEEEKSGYALKEWDSPDRRKDANQNQFVKFRDELGPQWLKMYAKWRTESGWQIATLTDEDGDDTPGIEYELNFTVGDVEVIAYVDRVFLLPDGRLVAIDTKTWSKRRVTPQLPTYLVGLRKMGFDVSGAAYYEARKGECTEIKDYKYWDEKRLAALHERAAQGIAAGFFVPRPSADCGVCDVRRHCLYEL